MIDVDKIAQLARRGLDLVKIDGLPNGIFHIPGPNVIADLEALEMKPRRKRGETTTFAAHTLVELLRRHGKAADIWLDDAAMRMTAIFNPDTSESAHWGDHRATFELKKTPLFEKVVACNKQTMNQVDFAEFIDRWGHIIVAPQAADLYAMALNFQFNRDYRFKSRKVLEDGTTEFQIMDEVKPVGELAIPKQLVFEVEPFIGTGIQQIAAKLRYRVDDGGKLNFSLHFSWLQELFERNWQRSTDTVASAATSLKANIMWGVAPKPIEARPMFREA